MWWLKIIVLALSFLTDSSLVLCSASVLVTTGSMRWYLLSNQVAQVVQLLQAHPYVRSQEGLLCLPAQSQEHGGDTRRPELKRAEQSCRVLTHQQDRYLLLCAGEQQEHCQSSTKWPPAGYWCACFWPNRQKQTPWGPDDLEWDLCSQPSTEQLDWHLPIWQLAGLPLAPRSLHRWDKVHTEHMWQAWKSL